MIEELQTSNLTPEFVAIYRSGTDAAKTLLMSHGALTHRETVGLTIGFVCEVLDAVKTLSSLEDAEKMRAQIIDMLSGVGPKADPCQCLACRQARRYGAREGRPH
ncbi:hypothetical protein PQU92_08170 [Asticcacaulis sp. BYS171W]|uniref:Uncharacterized protein n=1 Tax=Asticcacaulis aquaticus TaxID=2984212 RepID=A0ABT5HT89_9CAUL|nr:hypothetical protein [Asticcacaulis aquaticus]MDC7683249.1 hypothetical protein [Asticcacaulis aquaticus]